MEVNNGNEFDSMKKIFSTHTHSLSLSLYHIYNIYSLYNSSIRDIKHSPNYITLGSPQTHIVN